MDQPRSELHWWTLSRGLYHRILDNVGFDIEVVKPSALFCPTPDNKLGAGRPTIIAQAPPTLTPRQFFAKCAFDWGDVAGPVTRTRQDARGASAL